MPTHDTIDVLGRVLPLPIVLLAFYFGFRSILNLFRMVRGRNPEVSLYALPFGRFSLLLSPSMLAPDGLRARRRVLTGFLGFCTCFILVLGIGLLANALR
jgi:hypothetical protein